MDKTLELPPLVGSERQVAWAESIRNDQLLAVRRRIEHIVAHELLMTEGDYEQFGTSDEQGDKELLLAAEDWLRKRASAKWWIDRRKMDPGTLLLQSPQRNQGLRTVPGIVR